MPVDCAGTRPRQGFAPGLAFLDCVHCGLCLQACPTYVELGGEPDSPRGRIYLMRALSENRLRLDAEAVRHLDLCLGCQACDTACPSGVPYGKLIEEARGWVEHEYRRPRSARLKRRLLEWSLPEATRLSSLVGLLRLADRLKILPLLRRLAPQSSTLAYLLALLPASLPKRIRLPVHLPATAPRRGSVMFLEGCVMQSLFPETNCNTVHLLASAGFDVLVPREQVCCGALLLHLGNKERALELARRNIDTFMQSSADYLVTNAAGCGAMLKQYGDLLAGDSSYALPAGALAAKARDVHELLAGSRIKPNKLPPMRIAYHDPCHLAHAQGIRQEPRQLLHMIEGVHIVEIMEPDTCCGSGGNYNLLEPMMARRLLDRKVAAIKNAHADVVAVPNPGCALQIKAGLTLAGIDLPVKHPVDILAEATTHS